MTKIAKNRDFTGADLRNVKADDWVFVKCNFDRADLSNSSFKDSKFIFCSFDRSSWDQSNLEGASFCDDDIWLTLSDNYPGELSDEEEFGKWPQTPPERTNSPKCTATLSSFRRSNLQSTIFQEYDLSDSNFSDADLTNASFIRTILNHCSFKNIRVENSGGDDTYYKKELFGKEVSLEFADFSETNLAGIKFIKCKSLEAANFYRSDLADARFEGELDSPMFLYRACFDSGRLAKTKFINCDLDSASFVSADMGQVHFLGSSHANAALFINSYLAGCQAKGIQFIAANFSGALISTERGEGVVPASFFDAKLISANFSGAALLGVDFDEADMTLADFDSATFTSKPSNKEDETKQNKTDKIPEFRKTILEKAVFRNVILNGYRFIECNAVGAIFDKSDLVEVEFHDTSLDGCSFDDCYLSKSMFCPAGVDESNFKKYAGKKFPLINSTFSRSDLSEARFFHANLINTKFTGADLSYVEVKYSDLTGADFKNSSIRAAYFEESNLESVNFEQVKFDDAMLCSVRLSFAQFLRVRGKRVEIFAKNHLSPAQAVAFRLHDLEGKFDVNFTGAIIEHGSFSMSSDSNVRWEKGLHCVGSLIKSYGILIFTDSLIDNTAIITEGCKKLSVESSTIQSSSIIGLSKLCDIVNTTFDSCNIMNGWRLANFVDAKINLTNLVGANSDHDIIKIKLEDIGGFDKNSISALRANATSMGTDKGADHFFNLEKLQEINDLRKVAPFRERVEYLIAGFIILALFFIFPASKTVLNLNIESFQGYKTVALLALMPSYLFYLSKGMFLNLLYGYGHKIERIILSILCITGGFTVSFFLFLSEKNNRFEFSTLLLRKSFHFSVNSIVSIGFWGNTNESITDGPTGIMVLYSNIESFLGIIAIALLVATIVRRTSGR